MLHVRAMSFTIIARDIATISAYARMYVRMYVCIHVHTHENTSIHLYTNHDVCLYVSACIGRHASAHISEYN